MRKTKKNVFYVFSEIFLYFVIVNTVYYSNVSKTTLTWVCQCQCHSISDWHADCPPRISDSDAPHEERRWERAGTWMWIINAIIIHENHENHRGIKYQLNLYSEHEVDSLEYRIKSNLLTISQLLNYFVLKNHNLPKL